MKWNAMNAIAQKTEIPGSSSDERRSTLRNFQVAEQFPVSGVMRSPDWQTDVPVELINYHFRGACVRVAQPEPVLIHPIEPSDIVFDFYLGQHGFNSEIPIRIAWSDIPNSQMLGIEFLADSRGFVERAHRYLCHHDIAPQIKSPDPLDVNRDIYFKVVDISHSGMLLSTSLTNKHLLPGMVLEHADISVPGAPSLKITLTIKNIREIPAHKGFHLGVVMTEKNRELENWVAGYLSTMSPNFMRESHQSPVHDQALRVKRLKQGLTFRIISSDSDYLAVLKLRHQGYGSKGKLSPQATIHDQGQGIAHEGTIIGAYLSGQLVASMELRFGDSHQPFRTFDLIPREKLPDLDLPNTVEVNRLVVHPRIQGTDVVIGMVQKAHAIVMAQGGKDILFVATNQLKPLYLKIGCTELGVQVPHPSIKGVYLNAMVLTRDAFLDGRFLNPDTWETLYQATNDYFRRLSHRQTHRQTRLEVGIDLVFSLCMNIASQLMVYGALATAARSLVFAALVLGLAVPRRYAIRRLFNGLLATGKRQSRWQSGLEVGVDTVLGLCLAILLQWIFYGAAATWAKAGGLTVLLYALTMGRRYLLRRFFEMHSSPQGIRSLFKNWQRKVHPPSLSSPTL